MKLLTILWVAVLSLALIGCDGDKLGDGLAKPVDCTSCHGDPATHDPAPPTAIGDLSDTSEIGVGAHQAHLNGGGAFAPVACTECHYVPAEIEDPAHVDGLPAELLWGALAQAGSQPAWTHEDATCANVYCHGATLAGGTTTVPKWTLVDGTQRSCDSCHGAPPPSPHPAVPTQECGGCHPFEGQMPLDASTHPDGTVDLDFGGACGDCHGAPPTTGAHAIHYGDTSSPPLATYGDLRTLADYYPGGASTYMFGCGNCHPVDPGKHIDGIFQVELYSAAAPADTPKGRADLDAAYTGGTCTGTYCHSTGQEYPVSVTSPVWTATVPAEERCATCHDNPPAYASGGAGATDANTHVVLAEDGFEFGHFAGLPGPWHNGRHRTQPDGSLGASPITCQSCHYTTVDPGNTGPSGFFYLDTTGNYDLGGDLNYACDNCHTSIDGEPSTGTGSVAPLHHVNGIRDVVFDPRTTAPGTLGPLPTPAPAYPYWATLSGTPGYMPPDSAYDSFIFSLNLANASYDGASKSCSNVPCHLQQSFGTGDPIYDPLQWGKMPVGWDSCQSCHQF